jgi:hypothetical protein
MAFMVEQGIDLEPAGWLVNLAQLYGYVSIPSIWKGPDSWGSEIDFSITYVPDDGVSFRQAGYKVKFKEKRLY